MEYFLSDTWHELDSYYEHEHYSEADDDEFYDDDDLDFIKALYPILEYTCNESEEVFLSSKRVSHEWIFEKMFSLEHEAIAAVNSEEIWVPHKRAYTLEGLKVVYRCNKISREGPQCAAKIYSTIMLHLP